jgi:segregation and condensation protein B
MSNELKKKIEALLFIISKGLSINELVEKTNCTKQEAINVINELKNEYKLNDKAFTIINLNKIYRMTVYRELINGVEELIPGDISKSLIKTLSVIAWKQGISQGEVVRIRGNKAYEHIKSLNEMGFVNSAPKGKSYTLTLGDKFFEYFNISKGEEKFIFEQFKNN